jgi:hypothetical protein
VRDLWQFLVAVSRRWYLLVSGGVVITAIGVFERYSETDVALSFYTILLALFIVAAAYLAWRDEKQKAARLLGENEYFMAEWNAMQDERGRFASNESGLQMEVFRLRNQLSRLAPRRLTPEQRLAIARGVAPLVEWCAANGRMPPPVHVLAGSGSDCGDFAKELEDTFAAAGFRILDHSPGQSVPADDFHYGVWVRWDREWRDTNSFPHDGPVIADALRAAGIDVNVVEREGLFTSIIVGSRRQ